VKFIIFSVADDVPVVKVLEARTETLVREFRAVPLFDLPSGPITHRVFLVPDCPELDLSFTHACDFRGSGATFRLLLGEVGEQPEEPPTPAQELFGYAIHHTLHARVAIERGRYWQAEYWISALRDKALALVCGCRGLDGWYGRDSTSYPPRSWIRSTKRSCDFWRVTNWIALWEARLPHFFVNRLRPGKWSRTLKANLANWPRDQSADCSSYRPI
jgi:hypothetical protein